MTREEKAEAQARRAKGREAKIARALRDVDWAEVRLFVDDVLQGRVNADRLVAAFSKNALEPLTQAYQEMAVLAAKDAGVTNSPAQIATMANASARSLVLELVETALKVATPILEEAITKGWGRPKTMRALRPILRLGLNEVASVERYRDELKRNPARAARRNLRDRRFDRPLVRGQAPDPDKLEKMVERYRDRLMRRRSLQIARQVMHQAAVETEQAVWERAESVGEVFEVRRFWVTRDDQDVRRAHQLIPGLNAQGRRIGEAFVTPLGNLMYPCDPRGQTANILGCRCWQVFEARRR